MTCAWLSATPSATEQTLFEHCDYKIALQWWLGTALTPEEETGSTCVLCGACLDHWGDHAVTCRLNGITQRHSAAQHWLARTARAAGIPVQLEAALPDSSRPGDVLLQQWESNKPRAIDLTIVHPLRPSAARPTVDRVRESLLREEAAKRAKYDAPCQAHRWTFQPLVFHPWAGTTPRGSVFLHKLCKRYAENANHRQTKTELVRLFWQTLTCTLMSEVARQLRLNTHTGLPQGALPPSPVVDAAGNDITLPTSAKRPRWTTSRNSATVVTHQPYSNL